MKNLIGNSPRHPGLWTNPLDQASITQECGSITTVSTHTQGRVELKKVSNRLATLSHQGQWIVLISPPNIGYKQMLAEAGVRMDRVLLVHAKDEIETLWAMEKALISGTSSAVICWTQVLDSRDNRRLRLVEKSARALGIVIEDANSHLHAKAHEQTDAHFNQACLFGSLH
ncbi:cell division protein [Shewanella psychropiezotolerans]|uniref:Cell division protein n=1 Tax=Shewanella psychropiezotolerans TaxID=2593655 RepID=A0ABX5WYH1_9GAMM|nr:MULTISPECIES: SulA-like leucine-rich domain-containing protein [Shewanella]MPY25410.1 cell division protein [Shewanella sp. YLB-07]QDO82071.1 cell division protein [Shewanella psychropiezotolerans]